MADRVRYNLDRLAPLFKQLQDLTIFTSEEVKQIVKKITDYEYILRRHQLTESDYTSYIEYQLKLERLRYIRCINLMEHDENENKKETNNSHTKMKLKSKDLKSEIRLIEASIIRHIAYIFDRAIARFPSNFQFWIDYISFLKEKGSKALVNSVYGRLLSSYPKKVDVWIEAAAHELETNANSHTARILLQRALRFNSSCKKLWLYYFNFEIWNATRIVDRKRALDLDIDNFPLLGAPIVVLKHALSTIHEVDFGCEFHKLAKSVSIVLANKVEYELLSLFPNNINVSKYFLTITLESVNKSQSQDELCLERILKCNKAIEIISQIKDSNDIEPYTFISFVLYSIKILLNEVEAIFYSISDMEDKSLESSVITKKIKRNESIVSDLNSNILQQTDDIIKFLLSLISELLLIHRELLSSESLFAITCSGDLIIIQHRLGILLDCISKKFPLEFSTIGFLYVNSFPITESLYSQWIMKTMILYATLNRKMNDFKNIVISEVVSNNYNDDLSNNCIISLTSSILYFIQFLQKMNCNDIKKYLEDISIVFIESYSTQLISVLCSSSIGMTFLENWISLCNRHNVNLLVIKNITHSIMFCDKLSSELRIHWLLRYISIELISVQEESLLVVRDKVIEVYTYLDKILTARPQLYIHSKIIEFYLSIISIEEKFVKLYDKSEESNSIAFQKKVLTKAIERCKQDTDSKVLFQLLEDLERKQGNFKVANHLGWRGDYL